MYAVPRAVVSKYPNGYDREFEKKLDGPGITAYRQHLKSLGLVPNKDRTGSIIDYVKPDTLFT